MKNALNALITLLFLATASPLLASSSINIENKTQHKATQVPVKITTDSAVIEGFQLFIDGKQVVNGEFISLIWWPTKRDPEMQARKSLLFKLPFLYDRGDEQFASLFYQEDLCEDALVLQVKTGKASRTFCLASDHLMDDGNFWIAYDSEGIK